MKLARLLNFLPLITLAILGSHLALDILLGPKGWMAANTMEKEREKKLAELEQVMAERLQMEHRVNLMRSDSLDRDMLEEQARKKLGYMRDNERMVVYEW